MKNEEVLEKYYATQISNIFFKLDKNIRKKDIEELVKIVEIQLGKELSTKEIIQVYELQKNFLWYTPPN